MHDKCLVVAGVMSQHMQCMRGKNNRVQRDVQGLVTRLTVRHRSCKAVLRSEAFSAHAAGTCMDAAASLASFETQIHELKTLQQGLLDTSPLLLLLRACHECVRAEYSLPSDPSNRQGNS